MIENLDLKDDEDLQDLAMLVKNNLNKVWEERRGEKSGY
jgi:hypothetical protein